MTPPAGGAIQYQYTSGNNGIVCADGTTSGITRTDSNGQWQFARSVGTHSHTNVTDALGNASDYDFMAATVQTNATQPLGLYYEVNRNNWQGGNTSAGHQYSQQTCYNNTGAFCIDTAIALPITQFDTYQILQDSWYSGQTVKYTTDGLITELDTHDTASGTWNPPADNRGPILQQEAFAYGRCGPSNLISGDTVYDGNNNLISQKNYCYDETAPQTTANIPNHTSVTGSRGNLTTAYVTASGGDYLTTAYTYWDTGSVSTSTTTEVVNNTAGASATTSHGYDGTNTFVTSTTLPTPSSNVPLSTSATFDPATGVQTYSSDVNNQPTTVVSYDRLLRPTELQYPGGGDAKLGYSPNLSTARVFVSSLNSYATSRTYFDTYSRTIRTASDRGDGSWNVQDQCWDGNGNLSFKSDPYTLSAPDPQSNPPVCSNQASTFRGTAYAYDVLGRLTGTTNADGNVGVAYTGRDTVVTTNATGIVKATQVDGLGRLTAACEVTWQPMQGFTPGPCGPDASETGFLTTYSYSGTTTTIKQGASTGTQQTRIFVTDTAGRPVSISQPELAAARTFVYGSNSTGPWSTEVRPKANQASGAVTHVTTQYDVLGRVVTIGYDDGFTSGKTFLYDLAQQWNSNLTNTKGRMVREYQNDTGDGQIYSYDPAGRVSFLSQCFTGRCGNGAFDVMRWYTYDSAGNPFKHAYLSAGAGGTEIDENRTFGLSGEVTGIWDNLTGSANAGGQVLSSVYSLPYGPQSYTFGNGLTGFQVYDSLKRPSGKYVCIGAAMAGCSSMANQVYFTQASYLASQVTSVNDSVNLSSSYGYDGMNRLQTVTNSGLGVNLTYTYDPFGNRWSAGTNGAQLTFNTASNRITTPGYAYDDAGNLTGDPQGNVYTYDADGNLTQVTNGSSTIGHYWYDALNRRTRADYSGNSLDFAYGMEGQKVAEFDGNASSSTMVEQVTYWNGSPVAFWKSNGAARPGGGARHFQHQDLNGTERLRTTAAGSVEASYRSLPWGEPVASGSTADHEHQYSELDHDAETNTEHAQFRQYSSAQGRWLSPDPYLGSYDIGNPQSMNRYVYVLNKPLSATDPTGLYCEYDDASGDSVESVDYDSSFSECGGNGGRWYPDGWITYEPIDSTTINNESAVAGQAGVGAAPNNAAPKKGLFSCGWDALTSNGNGVSLLLDAAGFIPGESQLAAGAQTLVGFTSIANSIVHSDGTGAGLGSTGTVLTVTGVAAEGMGMAWAKAIPVAGYVVNGVASARDLYNTGSDVAKCLSHP